jgi:hypothetical protein
MGITSNLRLKPSRFSDDYVAVYDGKRYIGWVRPSDGTNYFYAIGAKRHQGLGRFYGKAAAIDAIVYADQRGRRA